MKPETKSEPGEKEEQHKPPSPIRRASKSGTSPPQNSVLSLQRSIGNQGVLSLLNSGAIKAKLRVSQPGDADEIEADRVAESVVSAPAIAASSKSASGGVIHRRCACPAGGHACPECEIEEVEGAKGIHRKTGTSSSASLEVSENFVHGLGPGQPMDSGVRKTMEGLFSHDFEDVRVHTDSNASQSAHSINARAFTAGRDVIFAPGEYSPQTRKGKELLAHELTHVVQQSKTAKGTGAKVHRRVNPEDVSSEMVGKLMTVTGPFSSGFIQLVGGESVIVLSWDNALPTARVQLPIPNMMALIPFDIPKRLLQVDSPTAGKIAHYSAGVDQEKRVLDKGDQAIAKENARRGGPRPGEIPRLQGLQQNRQGTLNRKMIQEMMMNRFDPLILVWVEFYNTQFGFTGKNAAEALDPNLIKSLFFQESQMGTSGQHMEIPTAATPISHPVRSRFNLAQVIDSSAAALLIMMREMQPALIKKYHLENISQDLSASQTEFQHLKSLTKRTAAQDTRLAELKRLSHPNWETFLWEYKAAGQSSGFWQAAQELFASAGPGNPALNLDYNFWIRTAVRWIFEKHKSVNSWPEAIRAYNGSGAAARIYRDAVVQRAQSAQQAQTSGSEFTPGGI
jgi:hypothetical protein